MLNIGPEKLVILLGIALVVLGPDMLPDTARKIANVLAQLRRMGDGLKPDQLLHGVLNPDSTSLEVAPERNATEEPRTANDDCATTR